MKLFPNRFTFVRKSILFYITITTLFCGIAFEQSFGQIARKSRSKLNDSMVYIANIEFVGNIKTKPEVMHKELTFAEGDTLSARKFKAQLIVSKNNLLNTNLFNYVTVKKTLSSKKGITVIFTVEERWYLWPYVVFDQADRNFNSWWETKDLSKIVYGVVVNKYNVRGRDETLRFVGILGYRKNFTLQYLDVFLDRKRIHGISAEFTYFEQNEVTYNTIGNLPVNCTTGSSLIKTLNTGLTYVWRRNLFSYLSIALYYTHSVVNDTIIQLNNNYFGDSFNKISLLSLRGQYVKDHRNSKVYPLTGYMYIFELYGTGFGLDKAHSLDMFYSTLTANYYYKISERFHAGVGTKLHKSSISDVYYIRKALGYKQDQLRGLEHYVVDGPDFALLKSNVKYTLLPTKIWYLNFFPFRYFEQIRKIHVTIYANAFADLGYVRDRSGSYIENRNTLVNRALYSGGVGFDIVTYYDKVFRFEYSMNQFGETGLFIHFTAPF